MSSEELCDLLLAGLPLGRLEHETDERVIRSLDRVAVDFEEQKCGFQANALVAIDERVVLDEVKQVRSSHLEDVSVQIPPAERHLGLR
jgi:hypothetical protein